MFGLLEMGSNSLKSYLVEEDGRISTTKFPWRIAHDFFASGQLSSESLREIVQCVRDAQRMRGGVELDGELCVATGVFREFDDLAQVTLRVEVETGVRVRVISGADEASLMARGFRDSAIEPPAVLGDLGGASMEWAWTPASGKPRSGSLRLGAIRNEVMFSGRTDYLPASVAACDEQLATLPMQDPTRVVVTGGTGQAISNLVGREWVTVEELSGWIERVQRDGAPQSLKPSRQKVMLAGLIILWRLVVRCQADGLQYGTGAVREGMVHRLIQLLQRFPPDELRATQLLRKTSTRS